MIINMLSACSFYAFDICLNAYTTYNFAFLIACSISHEPHALGMTGDILKICIEYDLKDLG